jgi:hypothetical protein
VQKLLELGANPDEVDPAVCLHLLLPPFHSLAIWYLSLFLVNHLSALGIPDPLLLYCVHLEPFHRMRLIVENSGPNTSQ